MILFDRGDSLLVCPGCRSTCLHHYRVETFDRLEDERDGLHVTVNGPDTPPGVRPAAPLAVDYSLAGNPSSRRHGLRVWFWCEECATRSALTIAQHKGDTFVALTPTEDRA